MEATEQLRRRVAAARGYLTASINTPEAFADAVRKIAHELHAESADRISTLDGGSCGSPGVPDAMYARAVADFGDLQVRLLVVSRLLANRPLFDQVATGHGRSMELLAEHLAVIRALDHSLKDVVSLMQYAEASRSDIDLRRGFTVSSGSTIYQRMNFAPQGSSGV